jgi:hypothetical protein
MEITPGNQKIEDLSVPAVEYRPSNHIPDGGEASGTTIRGLLLESQWICGGVDICFKSWTKAGTRRELCSAFNKDKFTSSWEEDMLSEQSPL